MPIAGRGATQVTSGARVWPASLIAWSPAGDRLAFASVRAGRPLVWVADVDDGRLTAFARTRISSARGHLAWAPGSLIAYQRHDHHNVNFLDPSTGDERPLIADTTSTFFFAPKYSPDGTRLAVWRNQRLWIFDLRSVTDATVVGVVRRGEFPLGWSADGRYVYTAGQTLHRVDTRRSRTPEPIITLPFREADCTPAGPRRPNAFICAAFDFVSDVWMIENFDRGTP